MPGSDGASKSLAYHHGDLRKALMTEAERILEVEGIQALTLRAAARAAGVSHTAPQNHFGDLTGLLSELAADGYHRFSMSLVSAMDAAGNESQMRAAAMGRAYVAFAREHPGLFVLMFRSERLDATRPALRDAIAGARSALRSIVAERPSADPKSPLQAAAQGVALWSLVHGYAMLMLDGRLNATLAALPGEQTTQSLFDAVLGAMKLQ